MRIPSKELDDIKNKVRFKKKMGLFFNKAGVKDVIDYLVKLLKANNNTDKRNKNSRMVPLLSATTTSNVSRSSVTL